MTLSGWTLSGRHRGETAYIVGRGPSLLDLTVDDFSPGPVIVLNTALLQVRQFQLPNPIYSMQQDACLVQPIEPEVVLLSSHLSRYCFPDYPRRHLFRIRADASMSSRVAVGLAVQMGAASIVMLAHDAYTHGDYRTVEPDGSLSDGSVSAPGYIQGIEQALAMALRAGVPIELSVRS
jgi:hypothetical protein